MKTTKGNNLLNSLMSQIDEREYEKVKSRMRLASKISNALVNKGLTQKEFAKMLGKRPSEVSKWLSGTHNFTHDTLVDIQSALKVELLNTHKVDNITSIENTMVTVNVLPTKKSSFTSVRGMNKIVNASVIVKRRDKSCFN